MAHAANQQLVLKCFLAVILVFATALAWSQDVQTLAESTVPAVSPVALDDPSIELEQLRLRVIPLTLDEVEPLAETWQRLARDAAQAVVDKTLEIREAGDDPAHDTLRDERFELLETRAKTFERFEVVIDDFASKGGDPGVIENYRAYLTTVIAAERVEWTFEEFFDNCPSSGVYGQICGLIKGDSGSSLG
jgi:small conductance mechanosensitive channel